MSLNLGTLYKVKSLRLLKIKVIGKDIAVADLGIYVGGSNIKNERKIFEATPTFALTTPTFDGRWRVLSSLSRLRAAIFDQSLLKNTRR